MTGSRRFVVDEDGRRLDQIARELYGTERGGTVEALLDANPGLAALGVIIPRGTELDVPLQPQLKPDAEPVRPWD